MAQVVARFKRKGSWTVLPLPVKDDGRTKVVRVHLKRKARQVGKSFVTMYVGISFYEGLPPRSESLLMSKQDIEVGNKRKAVKIKLSKYAPRLDQETTFLVGTLYVYLFDPSVPQNIGECYLSEDPEHPFKITNGCECSQDFVLYLRQPTPKKLPLESDMPMIYEIHKKAAVGYQDYPFDQEVEEFPQQLTREAEQEIEGRKKKLDELWCSLPHRPASSWKKFWKLRQRVNWVEQEFPYLTDPYEEWREGEMAFVKWLQDKGIQDSEQAWISFVTMLRGGDSDSNCRKKVPEAMEHKNAVIVEAEQDVDSRSYGNSPVIAMDVDHQETEEEGGLGHNHFMNISFLNSKWVDAFFADWIHNLSP